MNDLDLYEQTEAAQPCELCGKLVNLRMVVVDTFTSIARWICTNCYLNEADRG